MAASPQVCRRVVSPQGKRLTMICASLTLLQIMFAVHRFRSRGDSGSAAEGGGGALRAQIIKKPARTLRHFDRSGAEWRNLTTLWYMPQGGRRSLGSEFH